MAAAYNIGAGACPDPCAGGGDDSCVNDDSTTDAYGDTCTSWYDANEYPGSYGCTGGYDTEDFNAAEQCCACQEGVAMSFDDDYAISSSPAQNEKLLQTIASLNNKSTNNPQTVVNLLTGEVTQSGEAFRYVSYVMTLSYVDEYGYDQALEFETSDTELLIWGWSEGEEGCATVRAVSSLYGSTGESNSLCANAGGCPDADADGVCDDVDDCVGEYDECGECNGDGSSCACLDGDVNGDDVVNVSDIVNIVNYILSGGAGDIECADMNGDDVVNVSDIVQVVNYILGGGTARVMNATDATVTIAGNELSVSGNGFIQGVQLTLSHTSDFSIELADEYVAEYITDNNMTTVVLSIPEASYVSVKVYNLVGQEVATLANGMMEANTYTLTWDASSMSSGVYLVRAEGAGQIATQKLMLLK